MNDDLTAALTELVRAYLQPEEAAFASLDERGGTALFPTDGAAAESHVRSVTGRTRQVCRYPFSVVCCGAGMSQQRRAAIKEKLEGLGEWLERQKSFPPLKNGRLLSVTRTGAAHPDSTGQDRMERWVIDLAARYETVF